MKATMNKTALAIAIGSTLLAPLAHSQAIEMYGKAYPEIIFISGSGATAAGTVVSPIAGTPTGANSIVSRNEMQSGNSRLGFRGTEKLGGDLSAVFQLETAFGVDTPTAFATRDSFVGLNGSFGGVKLGRMDTPFKRYGDSLSFLGISSGNIVSTSNLVRATGMGGNSASSFHLRRVNAVQYESPNFNGFDLSAQYSTNETKTTTRDARVLSVAAKYETGPWYFAIAHEIHHDLFGGSLNVRTSQSNATDNAVNSKDKATQVTAKATFGIHTFEIDANKKKYSENATVTGRFSDFENIGFMLATENRWTPQWRTAFHYLKGFQGKCSLVRAACNTSGLDGTQLGAGFGYNFSKRTMLFGLYTNVKNGKAARYNNSDLQAPSVGEDIRQLALGISHSF